MSSEAALSRRGNHEDLVSSVYAAKTSICLLQGSNPGGVLPYKSLMGRAASQGMFSGIFVLNRVWFLRQEPITLFLDDKQPALMFYECLKLGIKNRNSVLNRVGKSAIFVLNRVRV